MKEWEEIQEESWMTEDDKNKIKYLTNQKKVNNLFGYWHTFLLVAITMKKLFFICTAMILGYSANCQDSNYVRFRTDSTLHVQKNSTFQRLPKNDNQVVTPHIYRDTRLGSSSPLYNTYKKNDYGAGAITTNPNKWGSGSPVFIPQTKPEADTIGNEHVYNERSMKKRNQP